MKVQARCTTRAWDSEAAVLYYPGGGSLPNGDYEIERDGKLAGLKSGREYVFEFDRANPNQKCDYTCKCGRSFETLNALGTHTRSEHSEGIAEPEEEDEPEAFADRTCTLCDPPKVCKSVYGLRLHMEKSHPQMPAEETRVEAEIPA